MTTKGHAPSHKKKKSDESEAEEIATAPDPSSGPGETPGSVYATQAVVDETIGLLEQHLDRVDTVRTALGDHVVVTHVEMDAIKAGAAGALASLRRLA